MKVKELIKALEQYQNQDADINTIINKNISIADGCIIAQGAVVVKSIEQPKSLAGGIPAKIIQSNINWKK